MRNVILYLIINKTAGYQWRVFISDKRMKAFFGKYCNFFIIFSNFSKFENFRIFPKKPIVKVERHLQEIISFDIRILKQICHLWRFWKAQIFQKKTSIFTKKKTKIWTFEKPYYFSRTLRRICYTLVIKNFEGHNQIIASEVGHYHLTSQR